MIGPFRLGPALRLPILLQGQVGECGLVSLAMIAHYHGHRLSLTDLRQRFLMSRRGTSLDSICRVAEALQFEVRAIRLEMDALTELQLPCVLHWNLNHFVVLKRVSPRWVWIHDPAAGERRLSHAECSSHFTGVALELAPAAHFEPIQSVKRLRLVSLLGRVIGLRRIVIQVVGLTLGMEILTLLAPFHMQWLIDQALLSGDYDLVTVISVGFLVLVFLQACVAGLRSWLIAHLSTNLNLHWLGQVFAHLMKLPLGFFERRHLGGIQSRFSSINAIQNTLTNGFVETLVDGLLIAGTLALMWFYSTVLSAIAVLSVGLDAGVRWWMFMSQREAKQKELAMEALQQTHFLETVRGIQSVRLFGRERERRVGWMNMLIEQFNATLSGYKLSVTTQTLNTLIFGCERVLVLWLGVLAVLEKDLSLGMLMAFVAYKEQFVRGTSSLVGKLFEFRMLRLHLDRVADIVYTEPESMASAMGRGAEVAAGRIELRNVTFRYAASEPTLIDSVNLNINVGECVAITGPSGCGKTTLIKILLGLLEPTSGDILVSGKSLQRFGLEWYRSQVGTVMQDDTLYTGSISENVSFFDPAPDLGRIKECARLAAVDQDIERMPMGYESPVSDNGTTLSGGERQRVLLARALYKQPRILVLDEATSHLDIVSEFTVNEAIRSMNLTRIIVAHRPDTINMAERVITMSEGRIVQDVPISEHVPLGQRAIAQHDVPSLTSRTLHAH